MITKKRILLLFTLATAAVSNIFGQTTSAVEGIVSNTKGEPIAYVNVINESNRTGIATDTTGFYSLPIQSTDSVLISFSALGYSTRTLKIRVNTGKRKTINVTLYESTSDIDEVTITISNKRFGNIERINHRDIEHIPSASGNFEDILKSLPGVSSTNEMSSQYSVRGGNFDENLVYVNNIEVYRPFLIRSGQQEGLSFINSDMVDGVEFSAGGFNAEYGDKMSSVLSIKYKTPNENKAKTEVSLLGANGTIEGISKNQRFSHITGIRYKTSQYILNSLDTKGDYKPSFFDLQSNLSWRISPKLKFDFLGYISSNSYRFTPKERETRFGWFSNALQLKVFYEGQEINKFETFQGAFTGEYRPTDKVVLKFIGNGYMANESETFDIIGQYLLNELDNSLGSTTYSDSLINVGIGGFMNHARNFLSVNILKAEHLGIAHVNDHTIKWGISTQHELISDKLNEWELIDSSGYAIPYNGEQLILSKRLYSTNSIKSNRFNAYVQDTYHASFNEFDFSATAGIRIAYWSFNQNFDISPRASIMVKPHWQSDISFHLSGGYYFQPPIYKELRLANGELNRNIASQKSIHAVLGTEYLFEAWNRPFRLQVELFHKGLHNLIPYRVDNVRIMYTGENIAKGFAQGIDFKLNGEFVDGAESWASLSIMRTFEDIENDSYIDDSGQIVYPGFYPRPTDQRINFGLFFQDYIPKNPTYRVYLTGYFGTGYPFGVPDSDRWDVLKRMPAYKRIDIGFTKTVKGKNSKGLSKVKWLNELWIGVEVFNLFDFTNTISYMWVQTVSNQNNESGKYAVPNTLTSRRINLKISANF
ncbi:MAG: TonB-dependent receptor [Bacteroidales bacterium]|nr:TonB-dependent receptor [Bacteroidales bacterium]MDD4672759.1 TonB-dependent receptor [Bacteroidales bacterium]MDY0347777.1 TonB-dependent receptor [Tenuifilaceae bacterium]